MPTAKKACPCRGCAVHHRSCPAVVPAGTGRCPPCAAAAEQARGTAQQRGYGAGHTSHFRPGVLRRNPTCACTDQCVQHDHQHQGACGVPSTVADHWPRSRRELVTAGLDPDDPRHGRGVCEHCHNHHTSHAQPGGWNAR